MTSSAGTYESCDCKITVSSNEKTEIKIDSIVFEQFGDEINKVLTDTLKEYNVSNILVECYDKGALDYTVKSRLITALKRGGYIE
jgi:citrate lyase subunit gamma (acyl carrier protein)